MEIGREEGAELVLGGKTPGGRLADGWFYRPTIFAGVRPGSRLEQEEIFGPVLSVIRVSSFDEAVKVNNDVRYGLSSSVYTGDVNLAFRAMQDLDNGITYVNAPTIGAEAHLPFGGVKATGNGHREGGWEVYDFYSETKVCYVDYSGKLQRAQIDAVVALSGAGRSRRTGNVMPSHAAAAAPLHCALPIARVRFPQESQSWSAGCHPWGPSVRSRAACRVAPHVQYEVESHAPNAGRFRQARSVVRRGIARPVPS